MEFDKLAQIPPDVRGWIKGIKQETPKWEAKDISHALDNDHGFQVSPDLVEAVLKS